MPENCPTKLLPDLPVTDDAFGAHARVAEAICSLVEAEEGGKAIALTGGWGSGKSTVVKILESKLKDKKDIQLFTYDAWEHQGDPLRRSFLESLFTFIKDETKWLDGEQKKDIQEKIDVLTGRITHKGKLIALYLMLLPIGYTLFNSGYNTDKEGSLLLRIIGILIPLSFIIFAWSRKPDREDGLLGLLLNKTIEAEPTSIEFQKFFNNLSKNCLNNNSRKLVVVMDNLDRISPEEALSIWSTMRIFFDMKNACLSRFWLIVPFDRTALQKLWPQPQENNHPNELVDSFVNKTFQIEIQVSPPVLSDWKSFFLDQLEMAFPGHNNEEELNTIFHLFQLKGFSGKSSPTPRNIKLFINEVGALHRQWHDEIPLSVQALYVLHKAEITESLVNLTKYNSLIKEEKLPAFLAALHFNVEPGKAMQVLIGEQVRMSLMKGDPSIIKDFIEHPDFLDVFNHVYRDFTGNHIYYFSMVVVIKYHEILNDKYWNDLKDDISHVKTWPELSPRSSQGMRMIIESNPDVFNSQSNLVERIEERLKIEYLSPEEIGDCLRTFLLLINKEKAKTAGEKLRDLWSKGYILHHLGNVEDNTQTAALCIFVQIEFPKTGWEDKSRGTRGDIYFSQNSSSLYERSPDLISALASLFQELPDNNDQTFNSENKIKNLLDYTIRSREFNFLKPAILILLKLFENDGDEAILKQVQQNKPFLEKIIQKLNAPTPDSLIVKIAQRLGIDNNRK